MNTILLAFDTETTGLVPWGDCTPPFPARPFAFAFRDESGRELYFRFDVDPKTREVLYSAKPTEYKSLKALLESPNLVLVGHNISFDLLMISKAGINFTGKFWDTKILAHVADSSRMSFALKPLCKEMFGYPDEDQKDLLDSVKKARREGKKLGWALAEDVKADYHLGDPELCKKYALGDVERTMRLYKSFEPLLKEAHLFCSPYVRYAEIVDREHSLLPIVLEMMKEGVTLDMAKVYELEGYYTKCLEKAEATKSTLGFSELNSKSPKQVIDVFYKKLSMPPNFKKRKDKKTGRAIKTLTVDKKILHKMSEDIPLAQCLLEYSEAQKQLTGFIRPFKSNSFLENGNRVLHPSFNTVGPITGRMSCSSPNLQNITSPDSAGKLSNVLFRVRECFAPPPGYVWLLADYGQIEIYCTAYLSKDKAMMGALERGEKLHDITCKNVFNGVPEAADWEAKRKKAKITNFLLQYRGTASALSQTLGIPFEEATVIVAKYWETYAGLDDFYKRLEKQYKKDGFVSNLFGRTYRVNDPRFSYKLGNYVSQGTAADIIKQAMVDLYKFLNKNFPYSKLILQVHDELIQKTPLESLCNKLVSGTIKCMQGNFGERLGMPGPLPVDVSVARSNWGAKEKYAKIY